MATLKEIQCEEEILSPLNPDNLTSTAPDIMSRAVERGVISVKEIARMIPSQTKKDRDALEELTRRLLAFFKARKVSIVSHEMLLKVKQAEKVTKRAFTVSAAKDLEKRYRQEIEVYDVLERELVNLLSKKVREGDDLDARNRMIRHNLRLVWYIAEKYTGRGLELVDLVQFGVVGLVRAIERFDERRGNKFGTYAVWWIKQQITRAIQQYGDTVRQPANRHTFQNKLRRASRAIVVKEGREPTVGEIADILSGNSDSTVTEEEVRASLRRMRMNTVQFEAPLPGQEVEESTWGDVASRDTATDLTPEERCEVRDHMEELVTEIKELVKQVESVSKRERGISIFVRRYGLSGSLEKSTLKEVGTSHDISRERVRQVLNEIWEDMQELGLSYSEEWLWNVIEQVKNCEDALGELADI